MNRRFLLAWVIVFVLWFIGTYIINAELLLDDWIAVPIIRGWEDEMKVYEWMVLPFVCYSFASVWLYQNFAQRQPWIRRGLLYGLVLSFITIIPMRMMNYASLQLPGMVLIKECVLYTIQLLILGVVIAWLYREPMPEGGPRSSRI